MTILDDKCDLCDGYVDPIGGDLAVAYDYKLWCGGCYTDREQKVALWLYRNWPKPIDSHPRL